MATISGSVSQRATYDDFYIQYDVVADYVKWEWSITAAAYLKVGWDFDASGESDTLAISIAGMRYFKTQGWAYNKGTWNMGAHNVKVPFDSVSKTIGISASTTFINAAGHGPGECRASGTHVLGARYHPVGSLKATPGGEDSIKLMFTNFDTNVPYARTVRMYYKKTGAASYTLFRTYSLAANTNYYSRSPTLTGLASGTGYTFRVEIIATLANLLLYSTNASATTSGGTFLADIGEIGDTYCNILCTVSRDATRYKRVVHSYIKAEQYSASSRDWVTARSGLISPGSGNAVTSYMVPGLLPNQGYYIRSALYRVESSGDVFVESITTGPVMTQTRTALPATQINEITQAPFTSDITVSYSLSSIVEGTTLTLEISNGATWDSLGTLNQSEQQKTFTLSGGILGSRLFRIKAVHPDVTNPGYSASLEFVVSPASFEWDSPKSSGSAMNLTAKEWNNFLDWLGKRELGAVPGKVNTGALVENDDFNAVVTLLGLQASIPVKDDGDSIKASDLAAIKQALNTI